MRDDYPEAEDTELNVTYGGNGSQRIVWAVACGATGVIVVALIAFLAWIGVAVTGFSERVAKLETQVSTLAEAVRDRRQP